MTRFNLSTLAAVTLPLLLSVGSGRAASIIYTDGFEGATFNSFWTANQQLGTVSLSTDQARSGTQSARFSSISGGQRGISLIHNFATNVQGTASVYLYDPTPGQQTLYAQMQITNSSNNQQTAGVGIQDFDAFCYMAHINNVGPAANCGTFPQSSTTNVPRTVGWHLFTINAGPASISFAIDGVTQFTQAGNYSFDQVAIFISGPGFRPNATFYFDDFSLNVTEVGSVPEPSTWTLLISGLAVCAIARRRSPPVALSRTRKQRGSK